LASLYTNLRPFVPLAEADPVHRSIAPPRDAALHNVYCANNPDATCGDVGLASLRQEMEPGYRQDN
jgi:hypothetical protein